MAIYRNVQTSFWEDTKVLELMTPEDRYFMLYLLTNPHTTQSGCYEISKVQMSNETGYNKDTIDKLLIRFESILSLIKYSNDTREILILNWYKYNWTSSPKVKKCIENELKSLKNKEFKKFIYSICIPYIYPMDTHTQEEKEEEQEKEEQKNNKKHFCETCGKQILKNILEKYNKQCENCFNVSIENKFNIFWNKYPKRVGKEKAKKAFSKTCLDDVVFSKILNSLEKFKQTNDWKKENGQYIPYPASWLNQKRWEDEFEIRINNRDSFTNCIDPELEKRFNMKAGEMYE